MDEGIQNPYYRFEDGAEGSTLIESRQILQGEIFTAVYTIDPNMGHTIWLNLKKPLSTDTHLAVQEIKTYAVAGEDILNKMPEKVPLNIVFNLDMLSKKDISVVSQIINNETVNKFNDDVSARKGKFFIVANLPAVLLIPVNAALAMVKRINGNLDYTIVEEQAVAEQRLVNLKTGEQ